jgi:hypothetical protein
MKGINATLVFEPDKDVSNKNTENNAADVGVDQSQPIRYTFH